MSVLPDFLVSTTDRRRIRNLEKRSVIGRPCIKFKGLSTEVGHQKPLERQKIGLTKNAVRYYLADSYIISSSHYVVPKIIYFTKAKL